MNGMCLGFLRRVVLALVLVPLMGLWRLGAQAPVIRGHPLAVSAYEGSDATFRVVADGPGLSYQWRFNGNNLDSATAPVLTISNVTAKVVGLYTVQVSNNAGAVVSETARLSLCSPGLDHEWQGRPWVKILRTDDPVPGTASAFGPLKSPFTPLFTLRDKVIHATARGDNDAANAPDPKNALVRWQEGVLTTVVFTNTPRPGGDGYFSFPFYPTEEGDGAVNFSDAQAMYEVRGAAVSAVLTTNTPVPGRPGATILSTGSFARRGRAVVISATLDTGVADKPGALLFLNGTTLTRIADDTTDLPGVMSGYAYRLTEDSVNFDGETIVFSTMASINGPGGVYRSTPSGVITKLLDTQDLIPGITNAVVSFGDVDVEGGVIFAVVGIQRGALVQNRIVKFEPDGSAQAIGNGDYLVASGPRQVYFGTTGSVQRWTDGVTETVINTQALLGCQRVRYFLDVEAQGDDVAVAVEYADGTAGIYANFGQPTAGPVRIVEAPRSVTTPTGAPATFRVGTVGPAPMTYQWFKGSTPIAGANQAVYTVLRAVPGDVAEYHVEVTAEGVSVVSEPARLQLTDPPLRPVLFLPPVSLSVPVGSPGLLQAVVAGTGPLDHVWTKSGQLVARGTSPILEFPAVTPADHGTYQLVVSNAFGSIPGYTATLAVTPILTRQPESQTVAPGGLARFVVEASGFPEIRYQWFKGTSTPLIGRTNAILELSAVQPGDAGAYSVNVSGVGGGSVRSQTVTLTVDGGGSGTGPTLGSPSLADGDLLFTLPTIAGQSYVVESRTTLHEGPWNPETTVVGNGQSQIVRVPVRQGSGFVRVKTVP